MTRGNDTQTKVHYKGKEDDFVVFVDSVNALKEWKEDKTKPLADVVSGWKVFVSHKQGAQGILDSASNAMMDSEFGTHKDDEVVQKILEGGNAQEVESAERLGDRNIANGPSVAH